MPSFRAFVLALSLLPSYVVAQEPALRRTGVPRGTVGVSLAPDSTW
jgi:hypothetical protein